MKKHNANVVINTLGPMFIFKAMDINHQSCPPSYKLSNDSSKTMGLHSTINIKKDMLVELCFGNYATFDGVNPSLGGTTKNHLKKWLRILKNPNHFSRPFSLIFFTIIILFFSCLSIA